MAAPGIIKWIGAALLLAGLIVGFVPVSSAGTSCGSAFVASRDARVQDFANAISADSQGISMRDFGGIGGVRAACTDLRSVVRIPAVVLGGLGLVGLIAGLAMSSRQPVREQG